MGHVSVFLLVFIVAVQPTAARCVLCEAEWGWPREPHVRRMQVQLSHAVVSPHVQSSSSHHVARRGSLKVIYQKYLLETRPSQAAVYLPTTVKEPAPHETCHSTGADHALPQVRRMQGLQSLGSLEKETLHPGRGLRRSQFRAALGNIRL
jgi:hypothetical protein